MKFSLSDSFRNFFLKNGTLELEEILSLEEADLLLDLITQKTTTSAYGELAAAGRDLWRSNSEIKKALIKSRIGEIAAFLYKKRPIRLGFTQTIIPKLKNTFPFSTNHSLSEISSIDPILGGVFLCLGNSQEMQSQELPDFKNQTKGSAIFFSAKYPIPFEDLILQQGLQGMLICFAPVKIRYTLQPLDKFTHFLKKSGYTFGDLIEEKDAPFLYH